jgi:hypothetical protein
MIAYCLLKLQRMDQFKDAIDDLINAIPLSQFWSDFFYKKRLICGEEILFDYFEASREIELSSNAIY